MKLLITVLTIVLLTSCGYDNYSVKLPNGSVVKAYDPADRGFTRGAIVCIKQTSLSRDKWEIDTQGNMSDTIYRVDFRDSTYAIVEYKVGKIISSR